MGGGDDGALVGSLENVLLDSSSAEETDFGILTERSALRGVIVLPSLEKTTQVQGGVDLPLGDRGTASTASKEMSGPKKKLEMQQKSTIDTALQDSFKTVQLGFERCQTTPGVVGGVCPQQRERATDLSINERDAIPGTP
jgi:hypothetical protein